jgi:hypothetical protein
MRVTMWYEVGILKENWLLTTRSWQWKQHQMFYSLRAITTPDEEDRQVPEDIASSVPAHLPDVDILITLTGVNLPQSTRRTLTGCLL